MYKRILLKLSGEALQSKDGKGYDQEVMSNLCRQIKEVHQAGVEVTIVVGGGNIIRGKMASQFGIDRTQADYMGMLATVINALAIQGALEQIGVQTRVQSAIQMDKVAEPYIHRRAIRHLEKGRVVVFAGGTGSPYFSTDTTAALRASELTADIILMAKNGTDGVYSADPNLDKNAVKYDKISYIDVISKNLQVLDHTAASMCQENNIDLLVFDINGKNTIIKAVNKENIGTLITKEA
ncbi:MAG: UMP kinase [Erysipelotrichaceae bacterium]